MTKDSTAQPRGHGRGWGAVLSRVWPRSLFGRLVAASSIAVVLAQALAIILIARERELFVLQESVREWSRRVAEISLMLQPMDAEERAQTTARLIEQYSRVGRRAAAAARRARQQMSQLPQLSQFPPSRPPAQGDPLASPLAPLDAGPDPLRIQPPRLSLPPPERPRVTILPLPLVGDFETPLLQTLQGLLGSSYRITITPSVDNSKRAIPVIAALQAPEARDNPSNLFDVTVQYPDGGTTLFRLARPTEGAPLPRNLLINLSLLVVIVAIALFGVARTITLPLSKLARAADRVGRDVRQPKLEEKGAREIRDAARAFNTMQERLKRYLDSRTSVLAAMSHDLKTPLTRLRLQVETLDDPVAQERIGKQLDEMESMVRGSLALFRGLDDDESFGMVDIDALLATLQSEFEQMGGTVAVEGRAKRAFLGKPQGLKRCLTNLIENSIKFGGRADVRVEDGATLTIQVSDQGPGVPPDELERVFEPFYRVESSRNRDTGGTGLGLSIARDIAQSHGGSLTLRNLPERGLEATLTLPR